MAGPGDLGRYELLIELGRGGMAELFLGRLRGAGGFSKLVAIKRILPHLAQDRQFTEMFLDEGRIASRLSHPNVCQVFELGDAGGTLFLAMEYLDGVSWDHLVQVAPRDPRLIAGVLAQAADGLHYAHTLRDVDGRPTPIVHRDVSPQNLFVTVDGVCKVLDFGVSKMMTDGPRTRSGVLKGKLPYMSPEQIRGEPLDGRADVFSLGVCAWEALARTRLYDRDTDFLIWKAITEEDAPPVAARWPACPPALAAVVQRALARDREHRQRTAQQLADELRGAAGFASPAELGAAVRTLCGARLAERAQRVAGAARPDEPAPATRVTDAGATLDLAAQRPAQAAHGQGVRLRAEPIVVRRDAASTLRDGPAPADRPRRAGGPSHVKTAVIAAASAAVISAVVVAIVMSTRARDPAAPIDASPPVAQPDPYGLGSLRKSLEGLRELEKLRDLRGGGRSNGVLVVDSQPAALIFANGDALGGTPVRAELEPGKYEIRAVLDDGRERTFDVDIEAGRETHPPRMSW